jgi:two-component system, chemotaxis family, protein-glutamate methylesterase/glutaminase
MLRVLVVDDSEVASWLDETTPLPVRLASDGQPPRPGEVVIAPAGSHLGLSRAGRVELSQGPPLDGHRPSATHLFASVARVFGPRAVGVILTGMGSDGAAGLLELRRAGGTTLARHVANAILREDSRGARLSKEAKDSPRRIDGAVATVMAVHRAAELAGVSRPDIYI